jgi:hypothetical protein
MLCSLDFRAESAEFAKPGLQVLLEQFEETALIVPGIVEDQVVQTPLDVLADHLDRLVGI